MRERSEVDQLQAIVASLEVEFGAGGGELRQIVTREYAHYESAPIRDFVPTFVYRGAREALRREHSRV